MAQTWEQYLHERGLTEIDTVAQQSGYRIRTVNDYRFELEPTSGYTEFPLREFDMTDDGRQGAREYLAKVQVRLEELQSRAYERHIAELEAQEQQRYNAQLQDWEDREYYRDVLQ